MLGIDKTYLGQLLLMLITYTCTHPGELANKND
jgi:hypothetical protein